MCSQAAATNGFSIALLLGQSSCDIPTLSSELQTHS